VEQHFNCLDTLRIRTSGSAHRECECGILLEIWPSGGIIQADKPLEIGEKFTINLAKAEIEAEVQDHEEDIYGSYIRFAVSSPWFPESYQPSYLTPEMDEKAL
jgi:hypothetical protein